MSIKTKKGKRIHQRRTKLNRQRGGGRNLNKVVKIHGLENNGLPSALIEENEPKIEGKL